MWNAVLLASAGCYVMKVAGLSVPARMLANARVQHVAALLPIALLSAFIATQTLTEVEHFTVDARIAGVGVAAVAVWRRAPFLVVIILATATTALVRLAN